MDAKLKTNFRNMGIILASLAVGEDLRTVDQYELDSLLNAFYTCCSFRLAYMFRKFDFLKKTPNDANFKNSTKSINQMVFGKAKVARSNKSKQKEQKPKKVKVDRSIKPKKRRKRASRKRKRKSKDRFQK